MNFLSSDLVKFWNCKIVVSILASSDIIRHILDLSRDIQPVSEACVTLLYPEPWYIQDPGLFSALRYSGARYIQNTGVFRGLAYSDPSPWYIHWLGIFGALKHSRICETNCGFWCEIAHYGESLLSSFQELFASINKTFVLLGRLGTGLSFNGVWTLSWYFLIS